MTEAQLFKVFRSYKTDGVNKEDAVDEVLSAYPTISEDFVYAVAKEVYGE